MQLQYFHNIREMEWAIDLALRYNKPVAATMCIGQILQYLSYRLHICICICHTDWIFVFVFVIQTKYVYLYLWQQAGGGKHEQ